MLRRKTASTAKRRGGTAGTGRKTSRAGPAAPGPSKTIPASNTIQRFQRAEVRLHWAIAAPFLICYLSSFVLFVFYNLFPLVPYRFVFAWIHRISGVCFIAFPLLVVATSPRSWKLFLYNIREAWIWALDDLKWLIRSGMAVLRRDLSLPEQGKFNAGEKLNFMMVTASYSVFIVTGIMIWMPGVSFYSWLVHFLMACLATPFLIGHIYMATINPSTRKGLSGMISGRVDREWARHHYARWFRELFGAAAEAGLEGEGEAAEARRLDIPLAAEADPAAYAEEVEAVLAECLDVDVLNAPQACGVEESRVPAAAAEHPRGSAEAASSSLAGGRNGRGWLRASS